MKKRRFWATLTFFTLVGAIVAGTGAAKFRNAQAAKSCCPADKSAMHEDCPMEERAAAPKALGAGADAAKCPVSGKSGKASVEAEAAQAPSGDAAKCPYLAGQPAAKPDAVK